MKTALCLLLVPWLLDAPGEPVLTDRATLTIYRKKEFFGDGAEIRLNGTVVVKNLGSNRSATLDVPAGRLRLESSVGYLGDRQTLGLTVEAGKRYFVKGVYDADFLTRTLYLVPVGEEQARQEMRRVVPLEGGPFRTD